MYHSWKSCVSRATITKSIILTPYSAARTKLHHEVHEAMPLLTDPVDPPSTSTDRFDYTTSSRSTDRLLATTEADSSTNTPQTSVPASRSSTPALYDPPELTGSAEHHPLQSRSKDEWLERGSEIQNQVPLLMTSAQKAMVKNLNEELPHLERVIAWFPTAYNSHATLIVR